MFLPHIVNLHAGKRSVGQPLLKGQAWMVGVHMDLNDLIIGHHYQRIADGTQIFLKPTLILLCIGFLQLDDKLRAVAESDVRCIDIGP